jgi:predicted acyl esterase
MGDRYSGHGLPGGNYEKVKDAWLDHYLMGKNNGIDKLAPITSNTSDYDGPRSWYRGGMPKTTPVTLYPQETPRTSTTDYVWKLLPTKPNLEMLTFFGKPGRAGFPSANINAETHANHHGRNNHDWFWFETPHLKRDTRIFGEIKVKLYSTVHRKWVTLTPGIVDIDPGCHESVGNQHNVKPDCLPRALQSTTRGFLDSRYRNGLGKQVDVEPGKPFSATVVTKPQDYVFKKGHYIALNVQTEIIDWMMPKAYPGCDSLKAPSSPPGSVDELQKETDKQSRCTRFEIEWTQNKSQLILPVVNAPSNPNDLFDQTGGHDH